MMKRLPIMIFTFLTWTAAYAMVGSNLDLTLYAEMGIPVADGGSSLYPGAAIQFSTLGGYLSFDMQTGMAGHRFLFTGLVSPLAIFVPFAGGMDTNTRLWLLLILPFVLDLKIGAGFEYNDLNRFSAYFPLSMNLTFPFVSNAQHLYFKIGAVGRFGAGVFVELRLGVSWVFDPPA
jgi:hypothetical protein